MVNHRKEGRPLDPFPVTIYYGRQELKLPDSMVEDDLRDAVQRAQSYVGHLSPTDIVLDEEVETPDGKKVGGRAGVLFGKSVMMLSLNSAQDASATSSIWSNLTAGSAKEYLWVATFEEAFHSARMLAGASDMTTYYSAPPNCTNLEYLRYLEQPEEKIIQDALNQGGVLRDKFGPTAVAFGKNIYHITEGNRVWMPGISPASLSADPKSSFPAIVPYMYLGQDGNLVSSTVFVRNEAELMQYNGTRTVLKR